MSNIEIEVRVKIQSSNNNLNSWLKDNASFVSVEEQEDVYYESIENSFLYTDNDNKQQADKWLRVRSSEKEKSICFKLVHRDTKGDFIFADEHETSVGDIQTTKDILISLGHKELCTVAKKRALWKYSNYYICIDSVLDLGDFIEIELINSTENMDIEKEKANILTFIREISNSEVEKIEGGYPWLLWNKS